MRKTKYGLNKTAVMALVKMEAVPLMIMLSSLAVHHDHKRDCTKDEFGKWTKLVDVACH